MGTKKPSLFKNNLEVKKQKEVLRQLEKAKIKLEKELVFLFDELKSRDKQNHFEVQRMFDKLPLETLRDLSEFAAGKRKETSTDQITIPAKIKRDHNKKLLELENLNSKINIAKQDLLIAKINCVTKKLDERIK